MTVYKEIVITPKELKTSKFIEKTVILCKKEEVLLTGKLFGENKKIIVNAVIVVIEISCYKNKVLEREVGYTTTNCRGEYAILLEKNYNTEYKLKVFEPLIKLLK